MAGSSDLAALLAESVGEELARDSVRKAMGKLGFDEPLDREQALAVLDAIAAGPGRVAVTARFAKPRLLLRWGK